MSRLAEYVKLCNNVIFIALIVFFGLLSYSVYREDKFKKIAKSRMVKF